MKRTVATLASRCLLLALSACSNEADSAADDMGVQAGRRPVPAEKRKPPGPPNAQVVTEEDAAKGTSDDEGGEDEDN
jgi:hypothetical protein